ncbi:hypothetical protein BD410DRAFT_173829 [Rickenella mellea]|uniref:Uncharacterized protein n=1 Tax=Rickenella mellea TaxID=50990 RepID=A0A4Y7Q6D7_9AGAM|nr:hypothetical protein BD410DRAFT_173829 [Rickenella mellea]
MKRIHANFLWFLRRQMREHQYESVGENDVQVAFRNVFGIPGVERSLRNECFVGQNQQLDTMHDYIRDSRMTPDLSNFSTHLSSASPQPGPMIGHCVHSIPPSRSHRGWTHIVRCECPSQNGRSARGWAQRTECGQRTFWTPEGPITDHKIKSSRPSIRAC